MKLIGSADEERYRKELRQGCKYLLKEDGDPGLLALLLREFGAIESAFFLSGYKLDTSNYPVSGTDGDGLKSAAGFGGDF